MFAIGKNFEHSAKWPRPATFVSLSCQDEILTAVNVESNRAVSTNKSPECMSHEVNLCAPSVIVSEDQRVSLDRHSSVLLIV